MASSNYICLLNNIVQNIIFADSNFVSTLLQSGKYDNIVLESNYPNQVIQIGYILNGVNFYAPGLPNDAYGETVVFSTNGTTDCYLVNNTTMYSFPTGTSQTVVYVSIAIQQNLALFQAALNSFIDSSYSLEVRFNFNALYILAQQQGLTNRMAYITQLFTWAEQVLVYAYNYGLMIQAMTNPATIAATTWNFNLIPANPMITPIAAIGITN